MKAQIPVLEEKIKSLESSLKLEQAAHYDETTRLRDALNSANSKIGMLMSALTLEQRMEFMQMGNLMKTTRIDEHDHMKEPVEIKAEDIE